jgi:hypothetical protein
MTLAFARTSDWASSGNRSIWSSAYRTSMRMLRPSTSPRAANASLNPVAEWLDIVRRVDAQDADNRQVFGVLRQCRDGGAQPQREGPRDASHAVAASGIARFAWPSNARTGSFAFDQSRSQAFAVST